MQGIKFSFDDETLFDGFAAGGTWNGFDNVKVTPEVAKQIDLHFREMAKRGGYGYDEEDDISRIPVGDDGLIDLSSGYATSIRCDHVWHFDADNIEVCQHCGEERGECR